MGKKGSIMRVLENIAKKFRKNRKRKKGRFR